MQQTASLGKNKELISKRNMSKTLNSKLSRRGVIFQKTNFKKI